MENLYGFLTVFAYWPFVVMVWMLITSLPPLKEVAKIALVIVVAFFFQFHWRYNLLETSFSSLRKGMSKSDVIRLMGLPKSESSENSWRYHYYLTYGHWQIDFGKDGKIVSSKRYVPWLEDVTSDGTRKEIQVIK